MSDNGHDEIEALLRRSFEEPVPDDGFSDALMQALPERRRVRWPLWLGVLLGALASGLVLASTPLLRSGWQDWLAGQFSVASIGLWLTVMATGWLVLGWGLAESGDR